MLPGALEPDCMMEIAEDEENDEPQMSRLVLRYICKDQGQVPFCSRVRDRNRL